MSITVLFFGATADIVGTRKLKVEMPEDRSSNSIFERFRSEYPSLSKHDLRFSINQNYATGKETLNDGDEIAIFTAVSGG